MIVSDSFVKSVKARDMEFTTNAGEEEEATDYHTTWSLTIYTLSSVRHSSILFSIHFQKGLTLYFYMLTCLWVVYSFPYISLISALALEQLDTETKVLYVCMYVGMYVCPLVPTRRVFSTVSSFYFTVSFILGTLKCGYCKKKLEASHPQGLKG